MKVIQIRCKGTSTILLQSLQNFQGNLKDLKEPEYKKLRKSIEKYGFRFPIFVWKEFILDGHQRIFTLKKMVSEGWSIEPIPVVEIEAENEKEAKRLVLLISSRYGHVTDEGLYEFIMTSELDFNELKEEVDLPEIDFKQFEQNYFTDEPKDAEPQIDRAEELNKKWQVKQGDLFEIEDHRLLCGDSLSLKTVKRFLMGEKVDLAFTDPPYGVNYSEKNTFLNAISPGNRIQTPIENDQCSEKDIMILWKKSFEIIRDSLAEVNSYYIFGPQIQGMMMMMMMMQEAGLPYRHVIIWVKNNHVLGRCDYHYRHEPIFFGWTKTHKFYGMGKFKSSVWEVDKPLKSDLHPTMKPVELFENGILNSSEIGQIVFDPFGGSGPCLVACQNTNRRGRVIEITPSYCAVILERMAMAFPGIEIKRI